MARNHERWDIPKIYRRFETILLKKVRTRGRGKVGGGGRVKRGGKD
jgi:hypothetical protein